VNRLSLALAVSVFAVAPLGADGSTGSSAAVARPCTSNYVYRPVEMPLKVTGDLTVRLRNPYGSKVNIGREVGYFFVQFRIVYASAADRAKVAAVQWTLDGQPDKWRRVERGRDHAYLLLQSAY